MASIVTSLVLLCTEKRTVSISAHNKSVNPEIFGVRVKIFPDGAIPRDGESGKISDGALDDLFSLAGWIHAGNPLRLSS